MLNEINVLRCSLARSGSPSTPFAARLNYRRWRSKSTGLQEKVTPAFSRAIRNLRRQRGDMGFNARQAKLLPAGSHIIVDGAPGLGQSEELRQQRDAQGEQAGDRVPEHGRVLRPA